MAQGDENDIDQDLSEVDFSLSSANSYELCDLSKPHLCSFS